MADNKIILLIGRSGRGKSTLANVVTNTNNFKESSGSVSETKEVQFEQFVDESKQINYAIIDTPGIGDTKMSDNEVLNIIAKAVYLGKDGISQVFFVNDGRFDQYEMATYDLLRTIIFDNDIIKHTTIVRTRFPEFRDDEEYQKDIDSMTKEARAKEAELKKNIADKKSELESLSSDDEHSQKLSEEIKKVEKELTVTNLAKIIESCQGRIVYVDNPSLEVKDTKKLALNKEDREDSRDILLDHLNENCQGEPYNPPNLKKLSEDIADDYFQYLKKKEELQKELEAELKRLSFKTSQTSTVFQLASNQVSVIDVPIKDNLTTTEENLMEISESLIIIEKKEQDKIIAHLQDKKERLKKEIAEKEKIIHQKVLKHIFNNYEAINKELGGDIFLNSVAGEHPWPEIHPAFANKELVVKWLSQGFDYEQIQKWVIALGDEFKPEIDADFCAWLRDAKKLTIDKVKRRSHPCASIEQLRQEYAVYLEKEIGMLDEHKCQLEKRDWKEIHPDFAKESFYYEKTYQRCWEENNLTYQNAQEWIPAGFRPNDYYQIKKWKDHNFTSQEARSWLEIGLDKNDAEFANYLRLKNVQLGSDLNLKELRLELDSWEEESKLVQGYLDRNYPKNQRKEIKKIDIALKNFSGSLDLSDFINLEELNCYDNQLTSLKLANPNRIKWINVENNYLTDLSFLKDLDSEKMTDLYIRSNNFPEQDLAVFSKFINLEGLSIGNWNQEKINQDIYNRFKGDLEFLQGLRKLKRLSISDTDVDSGLEYLPDSLETFYCSADCKKDAKCKAIYNLFANDQGEVETEGYGYITNFSQKLQQYKQKIQMQSQLSGIVVQTKTAFD